MTKFDADEFVRTHTHEEVDAEVDRLMAKIDRWNGIAFFFLGVAVLGLIVAGVLAVVR